MGENVYSIGIRRAGPSGPLAAARCCPGAMGITIREVARQAGVSIATVSRVLNGSGPVRPATRRRVEEAARALRYSPHGAARSLITNKTYALGVLLPDLYGDFFSEVMRGLDQTARRSRYHLLVSSSHDGVRELEGALQAMRGRVDGLVVMAPEFDARTLAANLPEGLPAVLLNSYLQDSAFDSVNIDNYGGAFAMVRHLQRHGHRRIALLKGAAGNYDADERLRGYREAMGAARLETTFLEFTGDFTEGAGYAAAKRVLELTPRPTALFALNDSMAIGALRALHEAGVRVPGDMALAGFDDIPLARYVSPALTSVHVSISEMGKRAVRLLMSALEEGTAHGPEHQVLPTRLVVRESCGGHHQPG